MADRLDALTVREDKNGKSWWTKIGSAFASKGGGWVVRLDAMPASQDGQYSIHLREPTAREDRPQQRSQPAARGFDDSDDQPF